MAAKRLDSIDILKGLMIIYVVMYHLFAWNTIAFLAVIPLLGSVMLLFFAMSGFTYSVGKRSWGESVCMRLKRLVLPLVLYEIGIYVVNCIILLICGSCTFSDCLAGVKTALLHQIWRQDITELVAQDLSVTFSSPADVFDLATAPYWFLVTMFFAELIFFAVARVVRTTKLKSILTIAGLMLVTIVLKLVLSSNLPFCLQDVPAIAGFMLLGLFFKENGIFTERKLKGVKFVLSVIGAYVVCLVIFLLCGAPTSVGGGTWGKLGAASVISALAMTVIQMYMLLGICDAMSHVGWLNRGLSFLGRSTMPILMMHCFFGAWIKYAVGLQSNTDMVYTAAQTLLSLAVVIVSMALCCLWQKLLGIIGGKRSGK